MHQNNAGMALQNPEGITYDGFGTLNTLKWVKNHVGLYHIPPEIIFHPELPCLYRMQHTLPVTKIYLFAAVSRMKQLTKRQFKPQTYRLYPV